MKAIFTSFWMEAKVSFIRDFILVFFFSLFLFFSTFTDFPFQTIEKIAEEEFSALLLFSIVLAYICLLLAVFCGTVFRDLDNKVYYNQHPVNYQQHYLGKCFYILFIFLLFSVIGFIIILIHNIYYDNSLSPYKVSTLLKPLASDLSTGFFMSGIILFSSLFRPFHYVALISIASVFFYLAHTWPSISHLMPVFDKEYPPPLPFLFFAPFFWGLGMILFERKMMIAPKQKSTFSNKKIAWLKKIQVFKWGAYAVAAIFLTTIFKMAFSEAEETQWEDSPLQKAKIEFFDSVHQVKNQTKRESDYFSFNFQKDKQWIFNSLSTYADNEWKQLHQEFFIPFQQQATHKIDVFIKTSQKHQLGSTRGSYVVLNAETINTSLDKQATLKKVFRHELAHVLINQISAYHFSDRTDIMGGFFHEGLATLVEHNWNSDDEQLIQQAALHFKIFDQTLFELIPKLGDFSRYDYKLNYSLGYVFWGEFVKLYGQKKIQIILSQLGEYNDDDYQYAGINYLFHKSKLVNVNLFKVFHATKQRLDASFNQLDQTLITETKYFKEFKVARLNQQQLLLPYPIQSTNIYCLFRKKGTFSVESRVLQLKDYSGRKGGLCRIPKTKPDEIQINIIFDNGIVFYSPWIEVPEL